MRWSFHRPTTAPAAQPVSSTAPPSTPQAFDETLLRKDVGGDAEQGKTTLTTQTMRNCKVVDQVQESSSS